MTRRTIEQRIALTGGREIIDELRNLGDAGQAAFNQIQEAAAAASSPGAQLGASLVELRREFVGLQEAAGRVGGEFRNFQGAAGEVGAATGRVALRAGALSAAVIGAGAGLVAFTSSATNAADEAGKTAESLGLTIEEFGRLSFAARQSGIEESQFASGIGRLNVLIGEAALGTQSAVAEFEQLGIAFRNTDGSVRSANEVLLDLANVFADLPAGPERSAAAIGLLGRSAGPAFINLLAGGAQAIDDLGDSAERLGTTFTREQVVVATAYNDSLDALKGTVGGIRNQIGILFAPALTEGSNALIEVLAENREAAIALGQAAANQAAPLVRDFIAVLSGQDAQVQNTIFLTARDAIVDFGKAVQVAVFDVILPAFTALVGAADGVAAAINSIFGTELSGQALLITAALLKFLGVFRLVASVGRAVVASIRLIIAGFGLIKPAVAVAAAAFTSLKLAVATIGAGFAAASGGFAGFVAAVKIGAALVAGALGAVVSIPALIVAGIVAAGIAIFVFWDEIVSGAKAAVAGVQSALGVLGQIFSILFQSAVAAVQAGWGLIRAAFRVAIDGLVSAVTGFVGLIGAAFGALPAVVSGIWAAIQAAGRAAFDGLSSAASAFAGIFTAGLDLIRTAASAAFAFLVSVASGAWDAVRGLFAAGGIFEPLRRAAADLWAFFRELGRAAIDFVSRQIDRLAAAFRRIRTAISSALQSDPDAATRRGEAFARGGRVFGPGTGTSDSIPAWLSNGEFVIRAAAVRKYGASFFAALNQMRMPKFAAGGAVADLFDGMGRAMRFDAPRFADGGLVAVPAAGRPVSLTIGGEQFEMTAPDDVADRLVRFATRKQAAALGRRPGWVR
jgi:hypothetical protein